MLVEKCSTNRSEFKQIITCRRDPENPYLKYQDHHHTHTCRKNKGKRKDCRFHIPLPVLPGTKILHPLDEFERDTYGETAKEHFKLINVLMESFYKNPREISFADILDELKLTEQQYVLAIRSPLKSSRVFPVRSSLEVGINPYNYDILCLSESNMDIQFVYDEYGLAKYLVTYILKADAGLSKLLRQACADSDAGNDSLWKKFRRISNVFINGTLISAQEAVYLNLSMPLSRFSVAVVFINTAPIDSRVHMLKSKAELKNLEPEDTNVTVPDVFEKYANRNGLDNVCLADFMAIKTEHKNALGQIIYRDREKPKVIRFVGYSYDKDKANYFRIRCLLYLPWRDEKEDIEHQNCANLYFENRETIEANQRKYVTIPEDRLEKIFNELKKDYESDVQEEDEILQQYINENENDEDLEVDIFDQGGKKSGKKKKPKEERVDPNRFFSPVKVSEDNMLESLEILNRKQREFVMHILKCFKTGQNIPFCYFLSGAAGVGKSTVINAIFQLVTRHFDNLRGSNPETIKVLLTAFSGKAAFLINGTTLHAAFSLPIRGDQLSELSDSVANSVRCQLIDLKLLIIDEISMLGTKMFHWVHQRLVQVTGKNQPFGGISVLVVGDMNQLPPVGDHRIFIPLKRPNNNDIGKLIGPLSP